MRKEGKDEHCEKDNVNLAVPYKEGCFYGGIFFHKHMDTIEWQKDVNVYHSIKVSQCVNRVFLGEDTYR